MRVRGASQRQGLWRVVVGAVAAVLVSAVIAPAAGPATAGTTAADGAAAVIATYRERIPVLMAEQDIPGLSVALVDRDEVLWVEGFGHLDRDGSAPVTVDTMFSVQSTSKNFTAVAVMQAVGAGLLDLDEPITTYLPDFTVHSAFEDHPERRITLRMLLAHTAGFTHEAPIGNNYEREPGTFEAHIASISDTWLRFPVGSGYAYSNLGIDLAGAILAKESGKPFADVLRDSLLGPLGMDRSTFDRAEILAASDRAIGHSGYASDLPGFTPMTGAGGLYTSATDLGRYLRFQLNDGSLDGRTVLDSELMREMRTVPAPHAGAPAGSALGVVRYRWGVSRNADLFSHGGGGFGFLSDLWWSPPIGVGIAVLTNSADHDLHGNLAISILNDLVHAPGSVFEARLAALPDRAPATDPDGSFIPPSGLEDVVASCAMAPRGDEAARWAGYVGAYRTLNFGLFDPYAAPARFNVDEGVPSFEADDKGALVHHRLVEVEPGLFLAENGETLDFRGSTPTWRSLELRRVQGGPAAWQWALLVVVGLAASTWLAWPIVAAVRRRRSSSAASVAPHARRWTVAGAGVGAVTAILSLAAIALIVALPTIVEAGFLGWLELPIALLLLLHVPLAAAVSAAILAIVVGVGWARRRWSIATARRHGVLVAASLALALQLAAWGLIGWGLS